MKILDDNNKEAMETVEVFHDDSGKLVGFAGFVDVHDQNIYVDTRTGQGYDRVIRQLESMVYFLAKKYRLKGFSLEDRKQHIVMRVLEGITEYDPRKNTKLSTFLQMRVNRRLINEIRDEGRMCRNPTILNVNAFRVTCECGANHTVIITKDSELGDYTCAQCDNSLANYEKKLSVNGGLISLDASFGVQSEDRIDNEYRIDSSFIETSLSPNVDSIITNCDLDNLIESLSEIDPRLVKIIELVAIQDYSVKAAAEKVGLSGAGASVKLKKLKDNKTVREIFNK